MSVGASQLRLDSFSAVFQNGCRFPQRFGKSSWRFALGDFPETPSKRHPDATPRTRLSFPPCTGDRGPPLQGGGLCRPRRRLRNSPAIRTGPRRPSGRRAPRPWHPLPRGPLPAAPRPATVRLQSGAQRCMGNKGPPPRGGRPLLPASPQPVACLIRSCVQRASMA